MDNTMLFYTPAEIDYRRQRATHTVKPRRRSRARTPWRRRSELEQVG